MESTTSPVGTFSLQGFKVEVFGRYVVQISKYRGADGETAWLTTSWSDTSDGHDIWITGSTFRRFQGVIWGSFDGLHNGACGPVADDLDEAESRAIREAIVKWTDEGSELTRF